MDQIAFLDPSVCSANAADNFITQICLTEIGAMFPYNSVVKVSSHNPIDEFSNFRLENSKFGVIGGTGILSHILPGKTNFQWKNEHQLLRIPFIGMGLGFENKDMIIGPRVAEFYRRIFADNIISVRGEYTKGILESIGVQCINTGCPSLWDFHPFVSFGASQNVVFNFNSYRKVDHKEYYEILKRKYKKVFLYCQHYLDLKTFKEEFPGEEILLAPIDFPSLAKFCLEQKADFIGTRVHSSIYVMKHGVRSIVIDTDCRTSEVIGEIGLPLVSSPKELCDNIYGRLEYRPDTFKTVIAREEWKEHVKSKF